MTKKKGQKWALDELLDAIDKAGGTVSRSDLLQLLVKHDLRVSRKALKVQKDIEVRNG